jgi:hypothetical protein
VSAYALTECTSNIFCILPDDGSKKPKHVTEFLILITNICCCVIDWINYYIIAKHNGMAPIEVSVFNASCQLSDAKNFEVAPRFLEHLCTPTLSDLSLDTTEH